MILVIGGRSKIGAALVEALVDQGEAVRLLARSGEPRAVSPGVETVTGDLADEGSLVSAMRDIEKVFLLSSPSPDALAWHRSAIDAARRSDVQLLVRSSILGSDADSPSEFVAAHGVSDRYLADSGLAHVIVRPNLFLQNIPESTIPVIDASGNFYLNAGDAKISMVDIRDVAAVAATVLTQPGHDGAAYDVTGPEGVSYADVAAALSATLSRKVTYVDVPDQAVRDALSSAGLTGWFASALTGLYQDYRRSGTGGYASLVTNTVERLAARPPRSLATFLAETSA